MRFLKKFPFILAVIYALFLRFGPCQGEPIEGQETGLPKAESSNESAQVKVIGYMFRALAKGLVATSDINSLKTSNIAKINKMSQENFHARYMDVYEHIYDCRFFTENYGLHEDMTKAEAIEKIRSLDKDKLYAIVDAVPDTLIASEFNRFMFKNKQEPPDPSDKKSFLDSLNKMVEYLKKKYL